MTLQAVAQPEIPKPLKWHGGKGYLASRIVALMPPHTHYVESFFGGGAVLLTKNPEGVSEVANDLNGWLTNFWNVLREPQQFEQLRRLLEATPFSESVFLAARTAVESSPSRGLLTRTGQIAAAVWRDTQSHTTFGCRAKAARYAGNDSTRSAGSSRPAAL